MKKSTKPNLLVAFCYDKVSETIRSMTLGETKRAIVSNVVLSGIGNRFPYRDIELRLSGEVDENGIMKAYKKYEVIPWDIYSAPIDERENLATLGEDVVKAYDEAVAREKEKEDKTENDKGSTDTE